MDIELINPNHIVRCVIGDVLKPSGWWKAKYACMRRTPWFLRIFGIYKDKYEWVIYEAIHEKLYCHHLFKNYYSSRDEFNKKHKDYYCDENWVVSRKAFVKLFLADGTSILKCFSDNTERDDWLSSIVGEVPFIKIDVDDE